MRFTDLGEAGPRGSGTKACWMLGPSSRVGIPGLLPVHVCGAATKPLRAGSMFENPLA